MNKLVTLLPNAPIIPLINTVDSPPIISSDYPQEYLTNTPTVILPNNEVFKLDALIESIKPSTIRYSTYLRGLSSVPVLPETLDLRNNLGPVRNQGRIGSCVSFGTSCMKEWQASNDNEYKGYLSPAFIYIQRSNRGQNGMYISNACDIIASNGVCTDLTLPYSVLGSDDITANKVTPSILTLDQKIEANKYRISNSVLIISVNDLKTALYLNGPCPFAVKIYGTSSTQFTVRPRMWAPDAKNKINAGGHCMCFVGYNSNGFIIRNSWGQYYNPQNSTSDMIGHDYLPFEDFTPYVMECWTTTDLTNPPPYQPPAPTPSASPGLIICIIIVLYMLSYL